ncbi:hypothetical protein Q5H92_20895 [Hymenobacter sp. M29]|uniref:Outer membrane protein beta-barrel domain-containing protein n=1 Tax=Hymenobacter mellowenesis TaxID=3063995 RepID=A0ABT9AG43_9BACT|nr:hypothetical protein [Hymenobacter sp. M29]MDO7848835.1 hypothetical protein [Hymenobacter sp. M29]
MMPEPEENRLDQTLRDKFEDFSLEPSAPVWAGIEQRIGAPSPAPGGRRRPLPLPLLVGLVALLSGLAGWLLPHGAAPAASVATLQTVASPGSLATSVAAQRALRSEKNHASAGTFGRRGLALPATAATHLLGTAPATAAANFGASTGNVRPASSVPGRAHQAHGIGLPVAVAGAITGKPKPVILPAVSPYDAAVTRETTAQVPAATLAPTTPAADATPVTLRPLAELERQVLVQLPSIATLQPGTPPTGSRPALLAGLRAERAELLRLQRHTDSLLLSLGDLPGAPLMAAALPPATPADTTRPRPLKHRWSLLLASAPEQNTLTLQGPEGDSLTALRRNHETGRAGFNAALLAEYRLSPRLSVGAGVGYSTYGADLRITNKTTDVSVTYNTTTTTTTNAYTSAHQTYSVRIIQIPQPSPVFNASGQVIRYDTVYVPRQDTVRTTTVQHDTVRTTSHVTTPLISKKETLTTKLLQPNYRFFTVPVLLRYRLAAPGTSRLWTDVAVGAQLQFFLGGTQVVTSDGENFRTEKITAGSGPFRVLNVGLTGSLALNYALTNRLSLSVAPSLRWQALSLYKPETGLRQQPTATGLMFGVRFQL